LAAYPGDEQTTVTEGLLNPLAEWPREQQLPLRKADTYSRIVRNVLHWCNRNFTDALMQVTFRSHQEEQSRIYRRFYLAIGESRSDRALLCAVCTSGNFRSAARNEISRYKCSAVCIATPKFDNASPHCYAQEDSRI
jgi:hypothetical protein